MGVLSQSVIDVGLCDVSPTWMVLDSVGKQAEKAVGSKPANKQHSS